MIEGGTQPISLCDRHGCGPGSCQNCHAGRERPSPLVELSNEPGDRRRRVVHDGCTGGRCDQIVVLLEYAAGDAEVRWRGDGLSEDKTSGGRIVGGHVGKRELVAGEPRVENVKSGCNRLGGSDDLSSGDVGSGEFLTQDERDLRFDTGLDVVIDDGFPFDPHRIGQPSVQGL